jgi:glucuronate isomerase
MTMSKPLVLHEDRLFPPDPTARAVARRLYADVKDLPIISPHGHTNPQWFAEDPAFPDPTTLFLVPDHYIFRMLYSHGISLESLGVPHKDGSGAEPDPRKSWRIFAEKYYLFRGTPTRMWTDHVFSEVFGIDKQLEPETADEIFDHIQDSLAKPEFRPRALYERFNIELISTTDAPNDDLRHHKAIKDSGWKGRVVPAFRPDPVVDPDFDGFAANLSKLGEITGEDTTSWSGYLNALAQRRQYFKEVGGCTSTDHGHPTARTADMDKAACEALFAKVVKGGCSAEDAELFRAQMLTEMARMSLDDGLVMQIHPGSIRNHNTYLMDKFGRDMGADIPSSTEYVQSLKPLLDRFGNERDLTIILFMLDESAQGREMAPLAGHYPCLRLGPPWWFFDSAEGMMRFRRNVTETAGFYNTVGFNDDTRAFLGIPSRHDVARRVDCAYLAELVADHRLGEDEAHEVVVDLAYNLVKAAYKV